mmetsp:Transcript_53686/g.126318  ORF Transcript_53686/g.126318 Transcript_53686/m.126318 type:complete len:222 (-) Transcript_53686:455-1120(-)
MTQPQRAVLVMRPVSRLQREVGIEAALLLDAQRKARLQADLHRPRQLADVQPVAEFEVVVATVLDVLGLGDAPGALAAQHRQGLVQRRKALLQPARGHAVLAPQRLPLQAPGAFAARDAGVTPVPAAAQHRELGDEVQRHPLVQGVFRGAAELEAGVEAQLQAVFAPLGRQLCQLHALGTRRARGQGDQRGKPGNDDGAYEGQLRSCGSGRRKSRPAKTAH